MNKEEIIQWLNTIYATLNRLDIKANPDNIKNLSAIYYEFERVINVLSQEGENNEQ